MKNVKITKKEITTKYSKEDVDLFKNELFIYLLAQQKVYIIYLNLYHMIVIN